jgi:hypothetical protein
MFTQAFTRSVGKVTSGFDKIGFAIKGIMSYQIATFFINQFGSAVKAIADFEYQMDKVAAISGATSREMKLLTDNAIAIGNASKFTAKEVGALQEVLARRGFNPTDIIEMTDSVRKLGLASDSALGITADAVGSVVQAFQFSTSQTDRIANTLAESFASTNLQLESFRTAIGYVGTAANQSNVSLEETVAMLGIVTNGGIKASTAGRGLRKIFLKLAASGVSYKDALIQVRDSQNPLTEAMGLFGTQFATVGVLLSENIPKIEELTAKYSDNNEELQKQVDIMEDNLLTDWDKFTSKINAFIVQQGAFEGGLKNSVQGLNMFAEYINLVNKSSETLLELYAKLILLPPIGVFSAWKQHKEDVAAAVKEIGLAEKALKIFNDAQSVGFKTAVDYLAVQRLFIDQSVDFGDRMTINQKILEMYAEAEKKAKAESDALNKAKEEEIVNLANLEETLKNLNVAYSLIAEDNKEALKLAAAEINSTQAQIAAIKAHISAEEDAFKRRQAIRLEEQKASQDALKKYNTPDKLFSSGDGLGMSLPGKNPTLDPPDDVVGRWDEFGKNLSATVMNAGLDIGDAFATFGADMLAKNKDAGKTFEASIASLAGSIGKSLITLGTGAVAFQDLLTTAFSNPVAAAAAIAVGAALVGYSKIATANIKNESNRRSKSPGGGSSASSQASPDYSAFLEATRGEMAFRINGADLVTAINNQTRKSKIN